MLGREQERWFYWLPVFLSFGVGLYFYIPDEPKLWIVVPAFLAIWGFAFVFNRSIYSLLLLSSLLVIVTGFTVAKLRTEFVRAPTIVKRIGPVEIEGWIERVENRTSGGHRITMALVKADKIDAKVRPRRLRLFVRSKTLAVSVGDYVRTSAILRPPPGPALPGGYDFARAAYFKGLGGVGYSTKPLTVAATGVQPSYWFALKLKFEQLRVLVGARIGTHLNGQAAAVAKALLTGVRDDIAPTNKTALRNSGLAHILAISGLHMAVMSGAVFWFVRAFLAAFSRLALRWPIKKWSAILAIMGALFYLELSGASAATQRAFIMICLLYFAVLIDRPALSLRNVAIAALIILVMWPESLLNIGFQMSFAAVTALIAFYESFNARTLSSTESGWRYSLMGKLYYFFIGITLTTIVAGLAIAPLSAFHFGREAGYSLLANLLALPIFSIVTMPMALVSLVAMPFGLEALPLQFMGWGIETILVIAQWVSSLPGAVVYVAAIPQYAVIIITLGALWLMIWREKWRYLGLVGVAFGLHLFQGGVGPDIYISDNGRTIAVRSLTGKDGALRLSATKGAGRSYALGRWLEKDGDARSPKMAAKGEGFRCDAGGCVTFAKNLLIAHGAKTSSLKADCQRADILITRFKVSRNCPRPRLIIDGNALARMGAHSVYIDGNKLRVVSVERMRGHRPWRHR